MVGDANLPSEGIYFSYPGKYSPEDKKNLVTEIILNLLNQAKTSIEIYAYSFDNPKLIESLQEARQRGVKIKIVGDTEKDYSLLIKSGFQIELWKASGLHHIKAILVDRSSFLFGTGNFSKYGLRSNYNAYFLKYLSPEEGDQVFQFLEEKYPESFLVLGEHILINSPSKGKLIQDTLIQQIQSATKEIHYLIFDHFDPIVSYALKEAAQRGVLIKAIYDSPVDPEGEYLSSLSPFIEVYRDGNEDKYKEDGIYHGGLLHHKSMLIDNKVLLSGSYNYSRSARDDNREMFIISYKPSDIEDFLEEYKRVEEHAYRVYPEVKDFLNPESIQNLSLSATNSLCIQKKIDFFPKEEALILDIQKGLFSSIIYIPIKDKKSCYPLSDRESISSGLAAFTKTVWFYDSEYFSGMNFSFRHSLQKEIYRENITLDIENI
ncbi:MAG: hypothetical protein KDK45_25145, partial [Leptospiraceae bacterium]|nr:hypothetical protein [Leptospiraceae bacterium]